MDLQKVLQDRQLVVKNLPELAKKYEKMTGKKICLSCPSSINLLIITLKRLTKMGSFEFSKQNAVYRNTPKSKEVIKSDSPDEKHIEFLRTNPDRISRYSKYPENWKELIGMSEEEIQAREAAKAELLTKSEADILAENKELKSQLEASKVEISALKEELAGAEEAAKKLKTENTKLKKAANA